MPVKFNDIVVNTVSSEQDLSIQTSSGTVSIGPITMPSSNNVITKTKMTFSSTGQSELKPASSVQTVTGPTATILEDTTILAVQYDGPVTLTLPNGMNSIPLGMYIVDEGGFSSVLNPITITTGTGSVNGDITITQPYSSIRVSPNPSGDWFLKKTATVVNEDGSTTITNDDGSVTTTALDGTVTTVSTDENGNITENVVSPDGTVTNTITDPSGNTTYTITSPDGLTVTIGSTETNGDYEFITTYPDGSTYEEEKSGTLTSTNQQNADGTSAQTFQLDSGFGIGIERDANGNITSFSFL